MRFCSSVSQTRIASLRLCLKNATNVWLVVFPHTCGTRSRSVVAMLNKTTPVLVRHSHVVTARMSEVHLFLRKLRERTTTLRARKPETSHIVQQAAAAPSSHSSSEHSNTPAQNCSVTCGTSHAEPPPQFRGAGTATKRATKYSLTRVQGLAQSVHSTILWKSEAVHRNAKSATTCLATCGARNFAGSSQTLPETNCPCTVCSRNFPE